MTSVTTRRALLVATVCQSLVFINGCSPTPQVTMPVKDDDFVSYFQFVHNAASGIQAIREGKTTKEQEEGILNLVGQLRPALDKLNALSQPDRQRLALQYKAVVSQARTSADALKKLHNKSPDPRGEYWDEFLAGIQAPELSSPDEP